MQHVKDLMVPLERYPHLPAAASLRDAIKVLEKELFDSQADGARARARAVLVQDTDGRVLGKLSLWDVLRGIEPRYGQKIEPLVTIDDYFLWTHASPAGVAEKACSITVRELLQQHRQDEYISEDAPLDLATHQLVHGKLMSLLVKRGDRIVGVLRLSDAFQAVSEMIDAADAEQAPQPAGA